MEAYWSLNTKMIVSNVSTLMAIGLQAWGGSGFEPGRLNQPWGVVVDSKDRVHILDSSNHRIQRIGLPV